MSAVELSSDTAQELSSNCPEIECNPSQNSPDMEKEAEPKDTYKDTSIEDSKETCKNELNTSTEKQSDDAEASPAENKAGPGKEEEGDSKNNDDLKASLNAIFARKESKSIVAQDKVGEDKVDEESVKRNDSEDVSTKEEAEKSENSAVKIEVPEIVVEETTEDSKKGSCDLFLPLILIIN